MLSACIQGKFPSRPAVVLQPVSPHACRVRTSCTNFCERRFRNFKILRIMLRQLRLNATLKRDPALKPRIATRNLAQHFIMTLLQLPPPGKKHACWLDCPFELCQIYSPLITIHLIDVSAPIAHLIIGLCPTCRLYVPTRSLESCLGWLKPGAPYQCADKHFFLSMMYSRYVMRPKLTIRLLKRIANPAGPQDSGHALNSHDSLCPSQLPGPARPKSNPAFRPREWSCTRDSRP